MSPTSDSSLLMKHSDSQIPCTPKSVSSMPSQKILIEKYQFPYSCCIFYSILISLSLFIAFNVVVFINFSQYSGFHEFNKEFYDSCPNYFAIKDLLKLRTEIYDNELVQKELAHVSLDKVSDRLKAAIEDEIEYKRNLINDSVSKCESQESLRKSCFNKNLKDVIKNQSQNINFIFKIYVPFSMIFFSAILIAFWKAKNSNFTNEQKKCYKIMALFFGCHVFVHLLILYSIIYDNSNHFKPNEIPLICKKDDPFLTEECYFNGTNCLQMFDLPKTFEAPLTIANYLFWQILLFVILLVLMVFSEDRTVVRDGYEEV